MQAALAEQTTRLTASLEQRLAAGVGAHNAALTQGNIAMCSTAAEAGPSEWKDFNFVSRHLGRNLGHLGSNLGHLGKRGDYKLYGYVVM